MKLITVVNFCSRRFQIKHRKNCECEFQFLQILLRSLNCSQCLCLCRKGRKQILQFSLPSSRSRFCMCARPFLCLCPIVGQAIKSPYPSDCQKGQLCLQQLCSALKEIKNHSLTASASHWVTRSLTELPWTAKNKLENSHLSPDCVN